VKNALRAIALCLLLLAPGAAEAVHAVSMSYTRLSRIEDRANLLHEKVRAELLDIADDTEFATGVQMMVVTAPGLPKKWKADYYAQYVAQQFGVTAAKPAVVMLLTKKEGAIGFTMSPGLSVMLNKKILAEILKYEILPELKNKDYQQALRKGTAALSEALQGSYKTPAEKRKQYLPFAILLPLVILMQVLFGDGNGARIFGGGAWRRW
jgi:uncharacterized protein